MHFLFFFLFHEQPHSLTITFLFYCIIPLLFLFFYIISMSFYPFLYYYIIIHLYTHTYKHKKVTYSTHNYASFLFQLILFFLHTIWHAEFIHVLPKKIKNCSSFVTYQQQLIIMMIYFFLRLNNAKE